MSFFIGMIVNAALLSIPIGASLGTMIAIKPFRDDIVPIATLNDAIIQMTYCDATHTFHAFAENKNGVNFTSEWGRSFSWGVRGYHRIHH
jgi:hypothetical protein